MTDQIETENFSVVTIPIQRCLLVYHKKKGENYLSRTRYSTSMLITDLSMKECRIHLAKGILNPEINAAIMALVKKMGYERAQFEVPEGAVATRHAKFIKNADGLDRYLVEISESEQG